MSVKQKLFLAPIAALVMISCSTQAATNAQITITGQISSATCDLNVTQSNIDLGTVISGDVATAGAIASTSKDFTLNLTNCSADQGESSVMSLFAKGTPLAANTSYFNNIDGGTVGVQLTAAGQPVKPNSNTALTSLTGLKTGDSAQVLMNAQLYSTVRNPASQQIEAPITFSLAYN
ncbi:hypothetical protein SOASR032_01780 [Pragia fontium]|uniref:Fimbrial protein n=1 Tax=Pragia fontium TaxID=82985 RepID=A0ABQ5LE63_9GAMM|nr:fimbrial protein [Pragia fontium]GKX61609.1 hypothetical protein SOASR032_01780 [Pragia fontium]